MHVVFAVFLIGLGVMVGAGIVIYLLHLAVMHAVGKGLGW